MEKEPEEEEIGKRIEEHLVKGQSESREFVREG